MKFLIGNHNIIVIDRLGIRRHKAPKGYHFEGTLLNGNTIHVLKPDAMKESLEELTQNVAKTIADRAIDRALVFHVDRTEDLLKRVLRAKNSSQAAEMVADEIRATEEQMQNRQEGVKI